MIIGSGVGGMSTAARLARRGHQVTILEQSGTPGGKLAGYERDGFVFDTGPSLLTLPAVYRDLFTKTGRRLETALDPVVSKAALKTPDTTTSERAEHEVAHGRYLAANDVETIWGWGTPATTEFTQNRSYGYPGGMNIRPINDLVIDPVG